MAARTRKISVNFFQIQPITKNEAGYERLRIAFNILQENNFKDLAHRLDYVLSSEYVKRDKHFLTGAINNGQTGGVMPLRRNTQGRFEAPIGPGERLGHPSCFVYDIERSILILENLPGGVSPADWCLYFKSHLVDSGNMMVSLIEKGLPEQLLDNIEYVTSFQVSLAASRERNLFNQEAKDLELGELTDLQKAARAPNIDCLLSTKVQRRTKRKKRPNQESLDKSYISRQLDKLLGNPEVKFLTLKGLPDEEAPRVDVINLLEFRLVDQIEVPISELSAANLNFAKRIVRLQDLFTIHQQVLARYNRPK
jgi:hypothetical protein